MIKAFYDPGFAVPLGRHIMPIGKFSLVAEQVASQSLAAIHTPNPLDSAQLLLVHTPEYLAAVRTGEPGELAESQKFPWSPALWPAVQLTNGAMLAAARAALREGIGAAVASGFHHACADHGEGFCTFNGLVLAGEILRLEGAIQKLAVLDMDLHYGNGTATLATTRPWLRQLSIYGNDYWKNICYRDVNSRQHVDGDNHRSVALMAGTEWIELRKVMEQEIPWLLDEECPDLLLYQAGADYLQDDPYSPLMLNHAALRMRDELVFAMARDRRIPIAWNLAGGYSEDISKVVLVHVNTFRVATSNYD